MDQGIFLVMRERRQVGEPVHPELESKAPWSRQGLCRCLPTGPTDTGDEQVRQTFLLPPDMRDWLPEDDIVHLILDAVALMDLAAFEATHKLGGAGQAPFAPSMLLSVLIYAYSHGVRSSRAIERLCGRDAGYRFIVGAHVPDHTVIARFRRRHVERLEAIFVRVLEMCREAGLIRLGLVVLDGTKVKANAALEANRSAATIDAQVARMVAEAEGTDRREDRLFGPDGPETLPKALARREDRLARLRACQARLERQAAAVAARPQAHGGAATRTLLRPGSGRGRTPAKPRSSPPESAGAPASQSRRTPLSIPTGS